MQGNGIGAARYLSTSRAHLDKPVSPAALAAELWDAPDLLQQVVDRLLQLRIVAGRQLVGCIFDHDIGLHAMILNQPLAVQSVQRKLRPRDITAVDEWNFAANAAHPAPGARTDHRSQLIELEEVGE